MADQFDSMRFTLLSTLQLAVPLNLDELMRMPEGIRTDNAKYWAKVAVDEVASRGDALQFGGKRGEAAKVFNAMAKGLAALALSPGGVLFDGIHWCVEHRMGVRVASITELECSRSGYPPVDSLPIPRQRPVETVAVGGVL